MNKFKKIILTLSFTLITGLTLFSCDSNTTTTTAKTNSKYYDVEVDSNNPYDHYFSNKVTLQSIQAPITLKKESDGSVSSTQEFIEDGIAKLKLKSITDGDTAVFYLNNEEDTYTVAGKHYEYVTIRFTGIDTPESTSSIDPWGKKASNYAKSILKDAEGWIVDALDVKQDGEASRNYSNRLDSNGTRWMGLVWYCPKGGDPSDLSQYRSYQLDVIEECYSEGVYFTSTRFGYTANKTTEPILYSRYNEVTDSISGEVSKRYGSLTLGELFFEAGNRMSKCSKALRVHGEVDDSYDYSSTPTSLTITEALKQIDTLMSKGTYVEVTGVITRFIGSNFYIQDKEGSPLYIYMGINGNSISDVYSVGDTIKIRGRLCEYGGQYQMSDVIFKKTTFTKVTDESEKVAMPEAIDINGMSFVDIKKCLGKLVTYNITIGKSGIGSFDKNSNYSLTDSTSIKNFEKAYLNNTTNKIEFYSDEAYAALNSATQSNLTFVTYEYHPDCLQVRINGSLSPSYDKSSFKEGSTYKVTGILSIYATEDYTKAYSYPSYQILVGNRNMGDSIVNEIELIS